MDMLICPLFVSPSGMFIVMKYQYVINYHTSQWMFIIGKYYIVINCDILGSLSGLIMVTSGMNSGQEGW